ncbi:MAG: PD40 domain-containing protein, partial [Pyrinomonadaceae bacterium]|nr:PD40 domain-containing protein [Pyrinomonadaceae bacterium]
MLFKETDVTTLSQLTNTSPSDITERVRQGNFQPSISDDGRLIAFASNRDLVGANSDANLEIFIYDTATQSFTQITDSSGTIGAMDAKISGNGLRLTFVKDAGPIDAGSSLQRDIILYDRTTGQTRVVASNVSGLALTPGRAISDDGARVVYAANTATNTSGNSRQVFLFDDRVNLARQITALGTRVEDVPLYPTISGDGSRIAFATRRNVIGGNSDASVELYTYDIPTGQFARVTDAPSAATSEVVSSLNDDGLTVAFHFPRVLSEAASSTEFADTSEIYVATLPARPQFSSDLKIFNGASLGKEPSTTEAISPNTIAVARSTNLAPNTTQAQRLADNSFPQSLDGTNVSVNGRSAQIFFVSPTQVNFHVPAETELGAAEVVVRNPDGFETRGTVTVLRAAPGVFTASGDGTGEVIALDAATLQSGPFDPTGAPSNERWIIIFATGVRTASNVAVTIAGRAVTVEATVASPDLPGLDQIHVVLPPTLSGAGTVPLVVRADNRSGNTTNITITGPVRRPTSISVSPTDPVISVGGSLLLKTKVLDQNGVELTDAPLQLNSTDSSIAAVDQNGFVRGVSPGNVTIAVSAGDISATVELRVFQPTLAINEALV